MKKEWVELYIKSTRFLLLNNTGVSFHEGGSCKEQVKMTLVDSSILLLPRTMDKYGLTCIWKCRFYQEKKKKSYWIEHLSCSHKIQTMKNKYLFSSRKILTSLPGLTMDNNVGWFLLGCKMEGCQRRWAGELLLGILDLIVRWTSLPGQGAGRKLHCSRHLVRVWGPACLCVCVENEYANEPNVQWNETF